MPNNDDLFAGLEVNGQLVVGGQPTVSLSPKLEPVDNSDLFEGLEIGENVIDKITPETGQRGFADIFTGSERIAARPELGTLPEFGVTEEGDTPRMALGLLSTFDPKAQQDIIAESIPEARFETTDDGTTIIEVPTAEGGTRRSVLNRPGFSPQDLTTAAAQVLSFIPAARVAALGKTLAAKVGIGATAAGATEQALQETGVALGRQERDPTATALAAGLGGVAEAVVPAIQAFRGGRQAKAFGAASDELEQIKPTVEAAQEATEATKVPLFQAQQTLVPTQLEKQAFVTQLPAGTQAAVKGLKAQNQAAGDAVETFINDIAPAEAVITGAEKVRTAAQNAVAKIKDIRKEKASPLFNQAFKEGADVDLTPVNDLISAELADLPLTGEIAKSLNRVQSLIKGRPPQAPLAKASPAFGIKDAPLRSGESVGTGKPFKGFSSRNTENVKAQGQAAGIDFGQELEPAGQFINVSPKEFTFTPPGFVKGEVDFKNPLVLEFKSTNSTGWKKDLSDLYDGKTGKALTTAIEKDGFDGILTVDNGQLDEAVKLSKLKPAPAAKAAPIAAIKSSKSSPHLIEVDPATLRKTESEVKDISDFRGDPKAPITGVVVDGRVDILDGHHRAKIAEEAGKKIKVVVLPPSQVQKMRSEGIHPAEMRQEWVARGKPGEFTEPLNITPAAATKPAAEAPVELKTPSLRLLHNAKLEIDQMLNKVGESSLGNTTKAKLTAVKATLLQQIDEASDTYRVARETFAAESPAVTKIQESIVGKIANLKDDQLKQVASKIFDPAQTNPKVLLQAKKAIIDADPDAWSQIVRVEIEKRLGAMRADPNDIQQIDNIPGQIFKALFEPQKRGNLLFSALDAEGKKNLKFLKTSLGRARLGREKGSQTAARAEIVAELKGGIIDGIRGFIGRPISQTGQAAITAVTGSTAEAAFNKRVSVLSKALFDPTWKAEMKKLRALNPNSPAAARAMTQLLNDVERTEAKKGDE